MPRTKLLRSIAKMFRDAHTSRQTGVPIDELAGVAAQRGFSRRKFMAGAAAAGATTLALPKRRAYAAKGQPTVAIIGGGIAGLNCALSLSDAGINATVYEASERLGGRMHSETSGYWANHQVSEWCGEFIDTGHATVRALCDRFGLVVDDLIAAQPAGSNDVYYINGHYYAYEDALEDYAVVADVINNDTNNAVYPTLYNSSTKAGRMLDHMSIYDYIEWRIPGGHGSRFGEMLDIAYAAEYGADTNLQSSLNLLYLLGFQPNVGWGVYGVSDEIGHIRGGNQTLPLAIANYLDDQVRTGYSMTRLAQTAGGRYQVSFDHYGSCVDIVADYVVCALPFAVLRNLDTSRAGFDLLKNYAIQNLGRGHNGKLQLQYTSRGWNGKGPWPGISDGSTTVDDGCQQTWDVTRTQAGKTGILGLYSGGSVTDAMKSTVAYAYATDPNVVRDATTGLGQVAKFYPGLTWNGRATQSLPHKDPYLNLAYSYWKTGQYTKFAGYEAAPMGNIYFAGEHTSIDFQGFMEGGASTGDATAQTLIPLIKP